eukprot:scaffold384543_cov169-Cyclotella_meneghiniana.AAC.1
MIEDDSRFRWMVVFVIHGTLARSYRSIWGTNDGEVIFIWPEIIMEKMPDAAERRVDAMQ